MKAISQYNVVKRAIQDGDSLCFYEQGKFCKVEFPKAGECVLQIKERADQYPAFIWQSHEIIDHPLTGICLIQ